MAFRMFSEWPNPPAMWNFSMSRQDTPTFLSNRNAAEKIAAFARNLGASAEAVHADALDVTTLRARISAALADPSSRVIVNYSRIPLEQEGDGHISPVAAFDAASDTVLILDVARYKYPPVWVPVATLLPAMQRVDPDSGRARGVLVLSVRRSQ